MVLLTQAATALLLDNGRANKGSHGNQDFKPVVKLFTAWAGATWLLSELDPNDHDIAFGLCDLGLGRPELGYLSLAELSNLRGPAGLRIERDCCFKADKTLQGYADEAHACGYIRA